MTVSRDLMVLTLRIQWLLSATAPIDRKKKLPDRGAFCNAITRRAGPSTGPKTLPVTWRIVPDLLPAREILEQNHGTRQERGCAAKEGDRRAS